MPGLGFRVAALGVDGVGEVVPAGKGERMPRPQHALALDEDGAVFALGFAGATLAEEKIRELVAERKRVRVRGSKELLADGQHRADLGLGFRGLALRLEDDDQATPTGEGLGMHRPEEAFVPDKRGALLPCDLHVEIRLVERAGARAFVQSGTESASAICSISGQTAAGISSGRRAQTCARTAVATGSRLRQRSW